MRVKDAVGRFGEQLAAEHLVTAGLTVLATNWRCRSGELDLVARDGDVLVFVEVKTRTTLAFGDPAEAVGPAKAARIRSLALQWIQEQRDSGALAGRYDLRFDVVTVVRRTAEGRPAIRHLRAAF